MKKKVFKKKVNRSDAEKKRASIAAEYKAMKKHFQTETLSIDKDYAVRAHAHACVELSFEWLKGELEYTPEQFARLQYRFMPSVLKEAYGIEGEY